MTHDGALARVVLVTFALGFGAGLYVGALFGMP